MHCNPSITAVGHPECRKHRLAPSILPEYQHISIINLFPCQGAVCRWQLRCRYASGSANMCHKESEAPYSEDSRANLGVQRKSCFFMLFQMARLQKHEVVVFLLRLTEAALRYLISMQSMPTQGQDSPPLQMMPCKSGNSSKQTMQTRLSWRAGSFCSSMARQSWSHYVRSPHSDYDQRVWLEDF